MFCERWFLEVVLLVWACGIGGSVDRCVLVFMMYSSSMLKRKAGVALCLVFWKDLRLCRQMLVGWERKGSTPCVCFNEKARLTCTWRHACQNMTSFYYHACYEPSMKTWFKHLLNTTSLHLTQHTVIDAQLSKCRILHNHHHPLWILCLSIHFPWIVCHPPYQPRHSPSLVNSIVLVAKIRGVSRVASNEIVVLLNQVHECNRISDSTETNVSRS